VTETLTVRPDSSVEKITVNSFFPTLSDIMIVVTESQVPGVQMTGAIVHHPDYAKRDKVTVIPTVIVHLVLYVG